MLPPDKNTPLMLVIINDFLKKVKTEKEELRERPKKMKRPSFQKKRQPFF
jgi:hypothetical protein